MMQLIYIMRRTCPTSLKGWMSIAGTSDFNSRQARHTEVIKLVLAAASLELKLHMHTYAHACTCTPKYRGSQIKIKIDVSDRAH